MWVVAAAWLSGALAVESATGTVWAEPWGPAKVEVMLFNHGEDPPDVGANAIRHPGTPWDGAEYEDTPRGGTGWFLIHVVIDGDLPKGLKPTLATPWILDRAIVSIDGEELEAVGSVDDGGWWHMRNPVLVELPVEAFEDGEAWISLQTLSRPLFHPRQGGQIGPVRVGDEEAVSHWLVRERYHELIAAAPNILGLAMVSLAGIYHLFLWRRRRRREYLWFGAVGIFVAASLVGDFALLGLVPMPPGGEWVVDPLRFAALAALIGFLCILLDARNVITTRVIPVGIFLGISIPFYLDFVGPLTAVWYLALLMATITPLAALGYAFYRRQKDAWMVALAVLSSAVGVAIDPLSDLGVLPVDWERAGTVTAVTSTIIVVTMVAALGRRYTESVTAAERFVPREFLAALGHDELAAVKEGDSVDRVMTIFFSDIRGFTSITENMDSAETMKMVTHVVAMQTDAIRANGGFVDKFIGDAVMALFPNADDAMRAAIACQKAVNAWSAGLEKPVGIGVGLHTGPVTLGTVGSRDRLACTVLGDAVNLASRIEGLTRKYDTEILSTLATRDALPNPEAYELRDLGPVSVKGKDRAVVLMEVGVALADEVRSLRKQTRSDFARGREAWLHGDFEGAVAGFTAVLKIDQDDAAARLGLGAAEALLGQPRPDGFDGVTRFTDK